MIRNKSIEELLDMEEEFHLSRDEEQQGSISTLVLIYEELYRKIRSDKEGEYAPSLPRIKQKLIFFLVSYGTYLKTEYKKDDRAARSTLNKALKYDRDLPEVHYRLGFLNYKEEMYKLAMDDFQNAISIQKSSAVKEYKLNDQQLYFAHLYLTNSTLHIAQETQAALAELNLEVKKDRVANLEMAPLFELLNQNEDYIHTHAFTIISKDDQRSCTREECEDQTYRPETLILYFSDRQISLFFNGREMELSKNQGEMLRYFLLSSTSNSPATKNDFYDLFENATQREEVLTNTYVQNVRRLRRKLSDRIPTPIIESSHFNGQTAYFYNQSLPFLILHRSDETFILD